MRTALFASGDPIAGLRGLATLTDPDASVAAVIDLPVIGARGDGKSQFIIHAIRALQAHAPSLAGAELDHNRDALRLVLDPRGVRPEATPPGVVPHFTFRVRASRFGWRATAPLIAGALIAVAGAAIAIAGRGALGLLVAASGVLATAIAALVARRRRARRGDVEVVFWDVAGEEVYSARAADYHAMLGKLVEARRKRATELGRAYAFAPVLICNPLALGVDDRGSPYERLRQLLPMLGALDDRGGSARALVAINRWSIVDPLCMRGAERDQVVTISAHPHGEAAPAEPVRVVRENVRVHCLDAEDGREGDVRVAYLRYDTAIRAAIDVDEDKLSYVYDDGPGAFGDTGPRDFMRWLTTLVRWQRAHPTPLRAPVATGEEVWARPS